MSYIRVVRESIFKERKKQLRNERKKRENYFRFLIPVSVKQLLHVRSLLDQDEFCTISSQYVVLSFHQLDRRNKFE